METEDQKDPLLTGLDDVVTTAIGEALKGNSAQVSQTPDEYRLATGKRFRVSSAQKAEIDAGSTTRQALFEAWRDSHIA